MRLYVPNLYKNRRYSFLFIAINQLEPSKITPIVIAGGKVAVKPKSKTDLSKEYSVHTQTIAQWCTRIGINTEGRKLSIKQVLAFYTHYGAPVLYDMDGL